MPNVEGPRRIANHAVVAGSSRTIENAWRRKSSTSVSFPGAASRCTNNPTFTILFSFYVSYLRRSERVADRRVLHGDPMLRRELLDRPLPVVATEAAVLLAPERRVREIVDRRIVHVRHARLYARRETRAALEVIGDDRA